MYILEKGLSYQRLIFVVQEKLDCPVQKPDYPVFVGLKHLYRTYPFTVFLSSLSLSLSLSHKNNREGDPKTPIGDSLVPPWNVGVLG
jgi:hypothetical protein